MADDQWTTYGAPSLGKKYNRRSAFERKFPNQVTIVGFLRFSYSIGANEIKITLSLGVKQEAFRSIHEVRLI